MSSTVVHVVRHGEVHNPDGVLYGRLPGFVLSEAGHLMARAVADHLRATGRNVTHVAASPLERAQQTAQPIAGVFGVDIVTDERVIEAENSFEGTVVRHELRKPSNWWRLRDPRTPSWGEPYARISARMLAALRAAREAAEGSEAVIVSHQLPIWTTYLALTGKSFVHSPTERRCSLASVTSVHFQGDDVVGTTYCEPARSVVASPS